MVSMLLLQTSKKKFWLESLSTQCNYSFVRFIPFLQKGTLNILPFSFKRGKATIFADMYLPYKKNIYIYPCSLTQNKEKYFFQVSASSKIYIETGFQITINMSLKWSTNINYGHHHIFCKCNKNNDKSNNAKL